MGRADRGAKPKGRESTNGAWAAAAVVLAIGGLGFGVVAQIRVSDLEDRVTQIQTVGVSPAAVLSTTIPPLQATNQAAEALVRHAFGAVYDPSTAAAERLAAVDDPRGVDVAFKSAASGQFAPQASQASLDITEVEFTSETAARVRYAILIGGQPRYVGRIGDASLIGGAWRVSRDTVCADLALVGANCG